MNQAQPRPRQRTCPLCWDRRRKCRRDRVNDECRGCKYYNKDRLDNGLSLEQAPFFGDAVAHQELYRNVEITSLCSLDVQKETFERNNLTVRFTRSAFPVSRIYNFNIDDRFNTQTQRTTLDTLALDTLPVILRDKDPHYIAIYTVSIICGYLHLLCSTILANEQVRTTKDDNSCNNEYNQYNLHVHFQHIFFSRLCELLQTSLENIRLADSGGQNPEQILNAFAAAAILRYVVAYFRRSLRHGYLSTLDHYHMSDRFRQIIDELLKPIEAELTQRVQAGCSTFPHWIDAIEGSLKKFRRTEETLTLDLTLHQIMSTDRPPPPTPPPILGLIGAGDVYLLSSPSLSPTLRSRDIFDIPDQ